MTELTSPKYTNEINKLEHEDSSAPLTKRVLMYGWDADNLSKTRLSVAPDGAVRLSALVSEVYDYIALTYVASGDGAGEIETVVYKDGGASGNVVATLTLAYNSDDKLSSVTKT